jgi:hydroxyacyl-ACP dehydratase HTD2-like protein with hotdog domain
VPKRMDAPLNLPGTVGRIVGREAMGWLSEGDAEMPPGHHLVYFPTRVRDDELLPDGCDELHWPGTPFMRRLWAGGVIRFNLGKGLRLDCAPAVCLETVDDVQVVGKGQEEKIIVTVRRNYGKPEPLRKIIQEQDKEEMDRSVRSEDAGDWAVLEERKLVFLRHKTHEQIVEDLESKDRVIKC